MPKLTKRVVDALKPEASGIVHWDDAIQGFGVQVWPTGRKSCIVKCRCRGRQIKIQRHGTRCRAGMPPEDKDPVARHAPTCQSAACFGAVSLCSGKFVHTFSPVFNALTFGTFLKSLLRRRPRNKMMLVVLDNARYHHAKLLRPLLGTHRAHLELLFLTPCSPQLAPIERVWKLTRRRATRNLCFGSLHELLSAVETCFAQWRKPNVPLQRLCRMAHVVVYDNDVMFSVSVSWLRMKPRDSFRCRSEIAPIRLTATLARSDAVKGTPSSSSVLMTAHVGSSSSATVSRTRNASSRRLDHRPGSTSPRSKRRANDRTFQGSGTHWADHPKPLLS